MSELNFFKRIVSLNAYKCLKYCEFCAFFVYHYILQAFINNPTLAAACLAYGDKLGLESTAEVAYTIVLCCYGNSIMTDDHKHMLEVSTCTAVPVYMFLQLFKYFSSLLIIPT